MSAATTKTDGISIGVVLGLAIAAIALLGYELARNRIEFWRHAYLRRLDGV